MRDISKVMAWADQLMRAQVESNAQVLAPIRERFRAMDLDADEVTLEPSYDEARELKGESFNWLPTLAYALSVDLADNSVEKARTVVVRGPGMADFPITFSPLH